MEIQPFGHQHTLSLYNMKNIGINCSGCERFITGPAYGCRPCKYFVHKSCGDLPREIQHTFHPQHPLRLLPKAPYRSRGLKFTCYACKQESCGFTYHCSECKFDLDILCACSRFTPISDNENNDQQIQHFIHHHPLILMACHEPNEYTYEKVDDFSFACSLCEQPIKGSLIYVCVTCNYFIHKSCAEWPQHGIQHPFHPPHPLTLLAVSQFRAGNFTCYACRETSYEGYSFHCSECQFDLHTGCGRFIPHSEDCNQRIRHFSHRHPLIVVECYNEHYKYDCHGCCQPIKGSIYVCSTCKFFVHKSCLELPREIYHPLHPQHVLTLLSKPPNSSSSKFKSNCFACQETCFGFTYHCSECTFSLDVLCSTNMRIAQTKDHNLQTQHFTHQHPLTLVTCHEHDYRFNCFMCKKPVKDLVYVCGECEFFIHKKCVELPQDIQLPFHPLHPLILHKLPDLEPIDEDNLRRCHACDGRSSLTFHCSICQFDVDTKCAMRLRKIENACNYGQQIQHGSHQHPLIPFEEEDSKLLCSGCFQFLEGPCYICPQCIFVAHKSCLGLPQEMQHPFHPQHPLTIISLTYGQQRLCEACGSYNDSCFTYNCVECNFNLDLECASLKPTIRYESHEHPLLPMDRHTKESMGGFQCSTCRSSCGDFFLRCVACNLNLHVECIPTLPQSAKHRVHRHTLTLSDPLPKDDTNEYYCDACEKERNPDHSVYCCPESECDFVAHIDCAVPELMKALHAVKEESYVAHQLREVGFILPDSERREDAVQSEDGEAEDADRESDATDSSLAAIDDEIEALTVKLELLKQEQARQHLNVK